MNKPLNDQVTAEFKQNLKRILEERKGTTNPKRLSLAAGLGETAVRDIIQDKSVSPKLETAHKVAKALKVPLYRLIPSMIDQSYEELAQKEEEVRLLREISDLDYESLDDLRKAALERAKNTKNNK